MKRLQPVPRVLEYSRGRIRASKFEKRFSAGRMARDYLAVYDGVCAGQIARRHRPRSAKRTAWCEPPEGHDERAAASIRRARRKPRSPPSSISPRSVRCRSAALRALKHGDSFALFNHYGDIVPFRGAPDGLYHCDTRYLSHLELRLNGPATAAADARPFMTTMRCSRPTSRTPICSPTARLLLAHDTLHIQRLKFMWQGSLPRARDRAQLRCLAAFGGVDAAVRVRFRRSVRGARPNQGAGAARRPRCCCRTARLALRYAGLDGVVRAMTVSLRAGADPAGAVAAPATIWRWIPVDR